MNGKTPVVLALVLVAVFPLTAHGKKNKNQPERAMLEKMEAVPCGAKQKGLSGLGSFWASVRTQDGQHGLSRPADRLKTPRYPARWPGSRL
jgi:hypothetical protein